MEDAGVAGSSGSEYVSESDGRKRRYKMRGSGLRAPAIRMSGGLLETGAFPLIPTFVVRNIIACP